MAIFKRIPNGAPLTAAQMDANLTELENISSSFGPVSASVSNLSTLQGTLSGQFTGSLLISGSVGIGTNTPDIFSRGFSGNTLGFSSNGETGVELNSSVGNGAYLDMGAGGTRIFTIRANTTNTNFFTTTGSMLFTVSGSDRMFISSNGNVGIGTTTPVTPIELRTVSPQITLTPSNYNGDYRTILGTRSGAEGVLQFGNNGPNYIVGGNTGAGGALHFYVNSTSDFLTSANGTLAMVLNSAGNVGIGTSDPGSKFDVTNIVNTAYDASNTLISGQTMRIANTSTTSGVSTNLLFIATGAGGGNGLGSISGVNTGIGSLALTFGTRDSGGAVIERMRIFANGNVAIQNTFVDNGSKLNITSGAKGGIRIVTDATYDAISIGGAGALKIDYPGVGGGRFELNDNGTLFLRQYSNGTLSISSGQVVSSSDKNLKIDDGGIENALEKILQLNPRYFYWKEESGIESKERQLGFYAQDVNNALGNEVANDNGNSKWGIYDRGLIAMLTKAIQELKAEFDAYKATHP
jgi:hypothetical protein